MLFPDLKDKPRQDAYYVNNVYPSIQGEGSKTGIPMVVVRLQGCDVGCSFCDTKETWANGDVKAAAPRLKEALGVNEKFAVVNARDLADEVNRTWPNIHWIMLTGGEPAQQDLRALVQAFHFYGKKISIETSGTALGWRWVTDDERPDHIVVSPKLDMPGGKAFHPEIMRFVHELKWVVGKKTDIAALMKFLYGPIPAMTGCEICLQPISQNDKATDLCAKACMQYGFRLSVQVHKYAGLQ